MSKKLIIVCAHSKQSALSDLQKLFAYCEQTKIKIVSPNILNNLRLLSDNSVNLLLTFDDGLEYRYPDIANFLKDNNASALSFVFPLNPKFHTLYTNFDFYITNKDVFELGSHSLTHSMVCTSPTPSSENVTGPKMSYYKDELNRTWRHGLVNREYDTLYKTYENDVKYFNRLSREIEFSKEWIERATGQKCKYFSYPYGIWNSNVVSLVKKHYAAAFSMTTTDHTLYTIPRIDIETFHKIKIKWINMCGVEMAMAI